MASSATSTHHSPPASADSHVLVDPYGSLRLLGSRPARPLHVVAIRGDLTVDCNTSGPIRGFWWIKDVLQCADCAVSNSQRNLDVLQKRGVRFPRAEVVYNIVAADGQAQPGEPSPVPRIVSIGALTALKAHDVLLQAAALLAAEGRAFDVQIAGDGPERRRLEGLAAELGVADRVHFLGEVPERPQTACGSARSRPHGLQ